MNKVPRFISLMADTTAKALLKDKRYSWFYEDIIKFKTGIDLTKYKLVDAEMNTDNKVKDYRADLIFEKGKQLINLELNQFIHKYTLTKNLYYALRLAGYGYLSGEDYDERCVTQVNINNKVGNDGKKNNSLIDYKLQDPKYEKVLKNINIVDIYILNYKVIRYNGTNKYETYLSMLTAESYEEMERIVGDLEEGRIIMEKLKELGLDDKFGMFYDAEIVQKKEVNSARKEGANNEKKSIAKNLLKIGVPVKDIVKATGLSKKQITSLM